MFPHFKGFDQRMVQLRALCALRYLGTKYGGQSYVLELNCFNLDPKSHHNCFVLKPIRIMTYTTF